MIAVWHGTTEDIPENWALADGNNGTMDLRDRYLKGVPDAGTESGSVGGSHEVTLSQSQLSGHGHGTTIDEAGDHGHDGERITQANHSSTGSDDTLYSGHAGTGASTFTSDGGHIHSTSISTTGGGDPVENRPVSIESIMIQRI